MPTHHAPAARPTARRVLATVAAGTLVTLGTVGHAGSAHAEEPSQGKLLLMLDASGSMKAKDPSGLTKIAAAKRALTSVVTGLPDDAQVGLRVYGATQPGGTPTRAACADTQLVHPVTTLDKPGLTKAINSFAAKGETPIAHSLTQALKDLGPTGKRNIVLVSDGEESCVPDPCPTVTTLVAAGVDLQIDTVGFGVNAKARKQLQCIADAGHGTYYDARDSAALSASLTKLSQRALRPFTVDGIPVTATEDAAQAPVIRPGRYTDTYTVGPNARYLRLARTPGSVPHLSLVARPGSADRGSTDAESWVVELSTPDGKRCDRDYDSNIEFFRSGAAMTVSVSANNANAGKPEPDSKDPCASAAEIVAKVEHTKGAGTTPVQLVYIEEPPAADVASLPTGLDPKTVVPLVAKRTGTPQAIVGGGGFGDAPVLDPGTYEETILPGEQIFYRVRLDFGQRAAFTADIARTGAKPEFGATDHNLFTVDAWTPALFRFTRAGGAPDNRANLSASQPAMSLTEYVPEVRYRNKQSIGNGYHYPALRQVSLSGYYYFAVNRAPAKNENLQGPITVRLNVAVEGKPSGQPRYAAGSPAASASPSATTATTASQAPIAATRRDSGDGGPAPLVWAALGLVGLASVGGAAYLARRHRIPDPDPTGS